MEAVELYSPFRCNFGKGPYVCQVNEQQHAMNAEAPKMVRKVTDLAGFSEQYAFAQQFGAEIVHSNGGLTVATDKVTGQQMWRCLDLREWEGKSAMPYCFSIAFNVEFYPQLASEYIAGTK